LNPHTPITRLKAQLLDLLDDVLAHDGYGTIRIDVKLLKRGQKEVILDCGKQHRHVIDVPAPTDGAAHLPRG